MTSKRNNCKFCGEYSGKSDVCRKCKERFPFKPSGKGADPFNRQEEILKAKRRSR